MINKIHNIDCVKGMEKLPNESIDLTITSPPYDELRTYNGFSWNFEETARQLPARWKFSSIFAPAKNMQ